MVERTAEHGLLHHQSNPVRVYSEDSIQKLRIEESRDMALRALANNCSHCSASILELGCGAADICGSLAEELHATGFRAVGVDCNAACLEEAKRRYPHLHTSHSAIGPRLLADYKLVILCEILEHLNNPLEVAKDSLEHAALSVISHPLDEPTGSQLSGSDHCWSLSLDDHQEFFRAGGHEIDESKIFTMGSYKIVLSRGHRKAIYV